MSAAPCNYLEINLERDYDLMEDPFCLGCHLPKPLGQPLCCICFRKLGSVSEENIRSTKPGEGLLLVVEMTLKRKGIR